MVPPCPQPLISLGMSDAVIWLWLHSTIARCLTAFRCPQNIGYGLFVFVDRFVTWRELGKGQARHGCVSRS